jgi:hypothetical protein
MATRTVFDPQGTEWRLRRKWVPRRLRWRPPKRRGSMDYLKAVQFADVDDLPVIGLVLAAVGLVLFAIALFVFVFPALVLLLELLLTLLLVILGVVGRVLFRRPWTIEGRRRGADHGLEWKVAGWGASGELLVRCRAAPAHRHRPGRGAGAAGPRQRTGLSGAPRASLRPRSRQYEVRPGQARHRPRRLQLRRTLTLVPTRPLALRHRRLHLRTISRERCAASRPRRAREGSAACAARRRAPGLAQALLRAASRYGSTASRLASRCLVPWRRNGTSSSSTPTSA